MKDPAKYEKLKAEYTEAVRHYIEQAPESIDGIDLELAQISIRARNGTRSKRNARPKFIAACSNSRNRNISWRARKRIWRVRGICAGFPRELLAEHSGCRRECRRCAPAMGHFLVGPTPGEQTHVALSNVERSAAFHFVALASKLFVRQAQCRKTRARNGRHSSAGYADSDFGTRAESAREIFQRGCELARPAIEAWLADDIALKPPRDGSVRRFPEATVGLAVEPSTFELIWKACGSPHLAEVPPDQDAREFELEFPGGVRLDILTTRKREGSGAMARHLQKFGESIQQVELLVKNVDHATEILRLALPAHCRSSRNSRRSQWHARQFFSGACARRKEGSDRACRSQDLSLNGACVKLSAVPA